MEIACTINILWRNAYKANRIMLINRYAKQEKYGMITIIIMIKRDFVDITNKYVLKKYRKRFVYSMLVKGYRDSIP